MPHCVYNCCSPRVVSDRGSKTALIVLLCSTRKQSLVMLSEQQDKDSPLTSILHRATIVDTLREENDVVPDFQRVTITGEETSGVRTTIVHRRRVLHIVINVELTDDPRPTALFR